MWWRAKPPSDAFVALGVAATRTPAPPPLGALRCVPRSWAARAAAGGGALAWDDVGLSGAPGGLWCAAAPSAGGGGGGGGGAGVGLGLLSVGRGTAPPERGAQWLPRAREFVLSIGDVAPLEDEDDEL